MKKLILLFLFLLLINCQQKHPLQKEFPEAIKISLSNPTDHNRNDELISIQIADLKEKDASFNPNAFVVIDGQNEVASQVVDENSDNDPDQIVFIIDFNANQTKDVQVLFAVDGSKNRKYEKRTQAEISHKTGGEWLDNEYKGGYFQNTDFLRVPPEHTDHSRFIRYEGPGWESDKVGYRFYLDWRNAIDIFGKKTSEMVLQNVGQDGFDSYHEMNDWGMDILKVGASLGIGSPGMWIADSAQRVEKTDSLSCQIISDGVIQSKVKTNYHGWQADGQKYNLTSMLTINAGSRLTRCDLTMDKNPENICSGIVKHDSAEVIKMDNPEGEWNYLATFGKQSLNNDDLGMALLFKKDDIEKVTSDKHSEVVVLKPTNGILTYYFLAAWEREPDGIKNKESFKLYLDQTIHKLSNPVTIHFN